MGSAFAAYCIAAYWETPNLQVPMEAVTPTTGGLGLGAYVPSSIRGRGTKLIFLPAQLLNPTPQRRSCPPPHLLHARVHAHGPVQCAGQQHELVKGELRGSEGGQGTNKGALRAGATATAAVKRSSAPCQPQPFTRRTARPSQRALRASYGARVPPTLAPPTTGSGPLRLMYSQKVSSSVRAMVREALSPHSAS